MSEYKLITVFPDGFERDDGSTADLAQASAAFAATAQVMLEIYRGRASMQMPMSHAQLKLVKAGEVVAQLDLELGA
jgi:hypothetical protein